MDIKNSVALVTGANRGLGRHLAAELLKRGAAKVYAGARRPESVDLPGVMPAAARHHRPGLGGEGRRERGPTSRC